VRSEEICPSKSRSRPSTHRNLECLDEVGSIINLFGVTRVHEMQRLAVEETRLKIPLMIGLDVLHGYKTIFPVPLGEAALFDPDAWEQTATEAAKEAAADGINLTFAPMLDISRDPRWGRSAEGPGEDPWLASSFARAKVKGFQGGDLAAAEAIARPHSGRRGADVGDRPAAHALCADVKVRHKKISGLKV